MAVAELKQQQDRRLQGIGEEHAARLTALTEKHQVEMRDLTEAHETELDGLAKDRETVEREREEERQKAQEALELERQRGRDAVRLCELTAALAAENEAKRIEAGLAATREHTREALATLVKSVIQYEPTEDSPIPPCSSASSSTLNTSQYYQHSISNNKTNSVSPGGPGSENVNLSVNNTHNSSFKVGTEVVTQAQTSAEGSERTEAKAAVTGTAGFEILSYEVWTKAIQDVRDAWWIRMRKQNSQLRELVSRCGEQESALLTHVHDKMTLQEALTRLQAEHAQLTKANVALAAVNTEKQAYHVLNSEGQALNETLERLSQARGALQESFDMHQHNLHNLSVSQMPGQRVGSGGSGNATTPVVNRTMPLSGLTRRDSHHDQSRVPHSPIPPQQTSSSSASHHHHHHISQHLSQQHYSHPTSTSIPAYSNNNTYLDRTSSGAGSHHQFPTQPTQHETTQPPPSPIPHARQLAAQVVQNQGSQEEVEKLRQVLRERDASLMHIGMLRDKLVQAVYIYIYTYRISLCISCIYIYFILLSHQQSYFMFI